MLAVQNENSNVSAIPPIPLNLLSPNTVQWLKNTAQLFNYSLRKQPSLMILARLFGFLPLLKWTY